MRRTMTGQELKDPSEGIWDDGEWISWDYINQCIHGEERQAEFPLASPELIDLFDRLVEMAFEYKRATGRYLPIFGELGELYAELRYGIKRHRPHAPGSDGTLGNDFVEVKTITPLKRAPKVHVKRAGNFSKLVVVKISADFEFEAKMIDRSALHKGPGRRASISWSSMPSEASLKTAKTAKVP
jgi:hypothetical protein